MRITRCPHQLGFSSVCFFLSFFFLFFSFFIWQLWEKERRKRRISAFLLFGFRTSSLTFPGFFFFFFFFFCIKHGCAGELQYFPGTPTRSWHWLFLCDAFPGGELAAGQRWCVFSLSLSLFFVINWRGLKLGWDTSCVRWLLFCVRVCVCCGVLHHRSGSSSSPVCSCVFFFFFFLPPFAHMEHGEVRWQEKTHTHTRAHSGRGGEKGGGEGKQTELYALKVLTNKLRFKMRKSWFKCRSTRPLLWTNAP